MLLLGERSSDLSPFSCWHRRRNDFMLTDFFDLLSFFAIHSCGLFLCISKKAISFFVHNLLLLI